VEAVVRGKLIKMFDLSGGPAWDAHQGVGAWLQWETAITKAQVKAHRSRDAALFPVVTANADLSHLRAMLDLCVAYVHAEQADDRGLVPDRAANARLMHGLLAKILGKAADLLSGEPGLASMLRRGLAGPGLGGPSLILDAGDTDDIPWHIRKAVDIRAPRCEFPSGCDRPATECQPHHIIHRAAHGATSVTGLKNYCFFHHHVLIHRPGWTLTSFPDGTSQAPDHRKTPTPEPGTQRRSGASPCPRPRTSPEIIAPEPGGAVSAG
jgi:hypothetical protein